MFHLQARALELVGEEVQHRSGQRPDDPLEPSPLPLSSQLKRLEPVLAGGGE